MMVSIGRELLRIYYAREVGTGGSSLPPQKHLSFSVMKYYHLTHQ